MDAYCICSNKRLFPRPLDAHFCFEALRRVKRALKRVRHLFQRNSRMKFQNFRVFVLKK